VSNREQLFSDLQGEQASHHYQTGALDQGLASEYFAAVRLLNLSEDELGEIHQYMKHMVIFPLSDEKNCLHYLVLKDYAGGLR